MGDVICLHGPGPQRRRKGSKHIQGRERQRQGRAIMSQRKVWMLFLDIAEADNPDQACEILASSIKSRSRLTYWLRELGHKNYTRLGFGEDFKGFLRAVACKLWAQAR